MTNMLFFPLRMLGWASAGFALAVGWKLGSALVNMAMQSDQLLEKQRGPYCDSEGPLWKRKFTKISND
jgi:hypothetical protein